MKKGQNTPPTFNTVISSSIEKVSGDIPKPSDQLIPQVSVSVSPSKVQTPKKLVHLESQEALL